MLATEHVDSAESGPGQINRLRAITNEFDIPLINMRAELEQTGNRAVTYWKSDGHWTPAGHRAAADAILRFLDANPAR